MTLKDGDIAGFSLVGERRPDSWIELNGRKINRWPEEITHNGNTFTLEDLVIGSGGHEEAIYC
jgi:hypothetical protein